MQNDLQVVIYKSQEKFLSDYLPKKQFSVFSFAMKPSTFQENGYAVSYCDEEDLPTEDLLTDDKIKSMAMAYNVMRIFINNDEFMQDVVDDMNENNPCSRLKYKLNKDFPKSFLKY